MQSLTGKQPNPSQDFLLVRHGKDKDTLTTELDQTLVSDSFDQINNLASCVKAVFLTDITFTIMHGPSKRSSQTARLLAKILLESRYAVNLEEDVDIKEFYQGQFHVDYSLFVNGKYIPLETAWEIFNTRVVGGEIHYKFGDPAVNANREPTYSLLEKFFTKYGETQSDFLFRVRHFVSKISNTNRLPNHLCVVITHQAVASRIQREITGRRLHLDYCEGVFVPYI